MPEGQFYGPTRAEKIVLCPEGHPNPRYSCPFCHTKVHRGDSGCACSTLNEPITYYASLCIPCARALATLYDDTILGKIHRTLVREADRAGRPSSD